MTEPAVASTTRQRARRAFNAVLFGLIVLLGTQLGQLSPGLSRHGFAITGTICGLIAGIIPALGPHHPRLARRFLDVSIASAGIMLGLLIRMIAHGFWR